jgi:hypothetical protein
MNLSGCEAANSLLTGDDAPLCLLIVRSPSWRPRVSYNRGRGEHAARPPAVGLPLARSLSHALLGRADPPVLDPRGTTKGLRSLSIPGKSVSHS